MKDRDMYYGNYGYSGFMPLPNNQMPFGQMIPTMPNQLSNSGATNYQTSKFNDINERIERLERQVKRLDQRLTRLETPYATNNSNVYNNEPDNNMYIM